MGQGLKRGNRALGLRGASQRMGGQLGQETVGGRVTGEQDVSFGCHDTEVIGDVELFW